MSHVTRLPQAKKALGQNFLTDQHIIQRIIDLAHLSENTPTLEIGPGPGALTSPLLKMVNHLYAIEYDAHIIEYLKNHLPAPFVDKISIINQDILKTDLNTVFNAQSSPWTVIGNLPYHISTPILFHLLTYRSAIQRIVVMLQKEVVQRIVSDPNTKIYGRLSVMLQYYFDCQAAFSVPAGAFIPAPKVTSQLLVMTPKQPTIPAMDETHFAQLVALCFQKRRKTLRHILRSAKAPIEQLANHFDLTQRPENLSVTTFVQLSNMIQEAR